MKKLCILLALMLGVVSITFAGCSQSNNGITTVKVNEVTHSIFYAPFYVAMNNGYFADEKIEIELTNGGGADASMSAILSGDADIGLMGPEASIYVVEGEAKDKPVVFGQLTKRDGSFIVAKNPYPNFTLNDLVGHEIIGGRQGGVPAMTLEYCIKNAGLEIGTGVNEVNLNTSVAFANTASVFETTDAEFCTLFEPTASELCASKGYYIVASVGLVSGEVPYTCFQTKQSFYTENEYLCERFLRAVYRGYRFLLTASVDEIYTAVSPSFAGVSRESIITSINSYIQSDAWVNNPAMTQTAFNALQDIMQTAGYLEQRVEFASVVDNIIANKVYNYFNF
ncbi:MAG: ABC transporter substrate-binding protein [Clostridiales bacterium]|nr:ABC transporter substrate-binding protein [Clostridiales bacterium]